MKKLILLLIVSLAALAASCNIGPPNPGFILVLTEIDRSSIFSQEMPLPGIDTEGVLKFPNDDASGFVENFHNTSGITGQIRVENGRAPGTWKITENNGPCHGQYTYWPIKRGELNYLPCIELTFPFNFSPSSINADAPPATFQITGSGMNAVYGMPTVQFRNYIGTLVARVRATSMVEGRITANATPLGSLPSGSYSVQVWNATANGKGKLAGTTSMRVYRPQPPPEPCSSYQFESDGQLFMRPPSCF